MSVMCSYSAAPPDTFRACSKLLWLNQTVFTLPPSSLSRVWGAAFWHHTRTSSRGPGAGRAGLVVDASFVVASAPSSLCPFPGFGVFFGHSGPVQPRLVCLAWACAAACTTSRSGSVSSSPPGLSCWQAGRTACSVFDWTAHALLRLRIVTHLSSCANLSHTMTQQEIAACVVHACGSGPCILHELPFRERLVRLILRQVAGLHVQLTRCQSLRPSTMHHSCAFVCCQPSGVLKDSTLHAFRNHTLHLPCMFVWASKCTPFLVAAAATAVCVRASVASLVSWLNPMPFCVSAATPCCMLHC